MEFRVQDPRLRQLGNAAMIRVIYSIRLYRLQECSQKSTRWEMNSVGLLQHQLSAACGLRHVPPPDRAANHHVLRIYFASNEEEIMEAIEEAKRFASLIHTTAHLISVHRMLDLDMQQNEINGGSAQQR